MTERDSPVLKLIVGLGNPGRQYQNTRHNLGFLVLEEIAFQRQLKFQSSSFCKGLTVSDHVGGQEFFLLLPLTFMNLSGNAVKSFAARKEIEVKNILVVTDDYNLPFGQLRLRRRGSSGGHNGLSSVSECFSSDDYPRLRIGVGAPPSKESTVEYVLSEFSKDEHGRLGDVINTAAECCVAWIAGDIEEVMNRYNRTEV